MNVYAKLMQARVDLQKMNIKKSGCNKFAGYDYYELGDILPPINELFANLGLFSAVSFTSELATLIILNVDKPEEVVTFTSPMSSASLKGCHEIQNLGAVETYQRRYLYTTALEVVEHDALDATTNPNDRPSDRPAAKQTKSSERPAAQDQHPGAVDRPPVLISESQAKRMFAVSGGQYELVREALAKYGYESSKDVMKDDYEAIVALVERMKAKPQAEA